MGVWEVEIGIIALITVYNTTSTPLQEQHPFPFSRKGLHPLAKYAFNIQHVTGTYS
jgi:hypothetical protein